MSFSKIIFSLVMSSPGGQGKVKMVNITPKALRHGINCVVIFCAKLVFVVAPLLYVHSKHLRLCRDGQLT